MFYLATQTEVPYLLGNNKWIKSMQVKANNMNMK